MTTVAPESPAPAYRYEPPSRALIPPHVAIATLFELHRNAGASAPTLDVRRECESMAKHLPCHVVPGSDGSVYLRRYGVVDLPDGGHVYLHRIERSDEDSALHDHPWPANALILVEGYREERRVVDVTMPTRYDVERQRFKPGDVNPIMTDTFHRIDLIDGRPAWTILLTGPKVQRPHGQDSWSFWDRATGATTGYVEYLAAKGLVAMSTPQNLASGLWKA